MRIVAVALTSLICASAGRAIEPGRIEGTGLPSPQAHHQPEYTLDQPADPAAWTRQATGLHAAFGSSDELYLRCEPPVLHDQERAWQAVGWRGERINAQVLVWSPDTLEQVRLTVTDLAGPDGHCIDTNQITLHVVRYVLSNFPYAAKDFTCDVTNDTAYLMPDRLEPYESFDLPARTVRPIWISVAIPADAAPGSYRGNLHIRSLAQATTLDLTLKVQNLVLPEPHDWRFRLDLWQNPWVVARHFRVPPWSEEHRALLRQHLRAYADAGGKYITTYAVHSPWSDNSYWLEGGMIDWIHRADGTWAFDYHIFDQYVELAMESGIDRAITIYTPIPWGHRFRYLEETSGNLVDAEWPPDSDTFRAVWSVFLDDLKQHLTQKGWLEKTYLGINENPLDQTLAAIQVIRQHSKDWKITYAGDWHADLSALIDDYSSVISREPGKNEVRARAHRGFTTSYYVCCTPPRPNTFVFSTPVESRYLGWHAAAMGYDGFLRWAYDAWPADPARDARHRLWPAGDCYLVYPGGYPSIRWEKLREGIVDYEKIQALRRLVSESAQENVRILGNELERHLSALSSDREFAERDDSPTRTMDAVHKGVRLIEALADELQR